MCERNICEVCESLIITIISHWEPVLKYPLQIICILIEKMIHQKLVHFQKAQKKVIANKSWVTVNCTFICNDIVTMLMTLFSISLSRYRSTFAGTPPSSQVKFSISFFEIKHFFLSTSTGIPPSWILHILSSSYVILRLGKRFFFV